MCLETNKWRKNENYLENSRRFNKKRWALVAEWIMPWNEIGKSRGILVKSRELIREKEKVADEVFRRRKSLWKRRQSLLGLRTRLAFRQTDLLFI